MSYSTAYHNVTIPTDKRQERAPELNPHKDPAPPDRMEPEARTAFDDAVRVETQRQSQSPNA